MRGDEFGMFGLQCFVKNRNFFYTLEEATANVEKQREKKLNILRKQVEKLEKQLGTPVLVVESL